jgi:hypothetical protein
MTSRRPEDRLALALVAVALFAAACGGPRDRLDVPTIVLTVNDSVVAPGGSITGRVVATDASGLVSVQVVATTLDSLFRQRFDVITADSIDQTFNLHVSQTAPADSPVEIRATAFDNQNFAITVRDTAFVRTGP